MLYILFLRLKLCEDEEIWSIIELKTRNHKIKLSRHLNRLIE